jgi:hypothetical protein
VCLSVIEKNQRGCLGLIGLPTHGKKRIKASSEHWINNVTNILFQQVSSIAYEDSFKNNVPRRLMVVEICEGRIPSIFKVQQFSHSSWINRSWKWRRHVPPKRQYLFATWHAVTSQKTSARFSEFTYSFRTSNISHFGYDVYCCYEKCSHVNGKNGPFSFLAVISKNSSFSEVHYTYLSL